MRLEASNQLDNVALVTGASRGIGLEISRLLALEGVKVVLTARRLDDAIQAAEQIGLPQMVSPKALDVTRMSSCRQCVDEVIASFGRIDILVNNAGISLDWQSSLWQLDEQSLSDTLATNAIGPLRLCLMIVPQMRDRGRGHVLNISSDSGQLATMGANAPAYRLSKALLNAVTRLVASAAGDSVKVNAVHPGWTSTAMGGDKAPRSAADAAASLIWLTHLPSDGPTGFLFFDRQVLAW